MDFASAPADSSAPASSEATSGRGAPATNRGPRRLRWWLAGLVSAALVVILFFLWPYQEDLGERRSLAWGLHYIAVTLSNGEWVFCLFVPILVAIILWIQRRELAAAPVRPNPWGLALILVASVLYWTGFKADTRYLGFAATQVLVAGLVIWFLGFGFFRVVGFAWLFLVFTWPIPPLEDALAFPLRLMTARATATVLNGVGLDCVRYGTAVVSSGGGAEGARFALDVEQPCSGIRSLFSLMMISAFFGFLSLRGALPRILLFAASIPLAMLGNLVRMLMLALGSVWWGAGFAVGTNDDPSFYHTFSGFVVFAVALGGLFLLSNLLERLEPRVASPSREPGGSARAITSHPGPSITRSITAATVGAAVVITCANTPVATSLSPPGLSLDLPFIVDGRFGEELTMNPKEKRIFDEGVELARRRYQAPDKLPILATVVLSGHLKRSLHKPQVCLPAQAWTIRSEEPMDIALSDGRTIHASLLRLFSDRRDPASPAPVRVQAYNIFWYQGRDTSVATYQGHRLTGYLDNVFRNINHRWAMASFFVAVPPVPDAEAGEDEILAELEAFIVEIAPDLLAADPAA